MTQQPPNKISENAPTPTRPPQTTAPTPSKSINVNNLGYYLDGWADLIEGMGNKYNEVQTRVLEGLRERNMPGIYPSFITGYVGDLGKRRVYTITETSPGATTTIYIGKHGKDLYTSWRTYIRPVPNWVTIGVAAGIALFIGLVVSEMRSLWTFLITTFVMMSFGFGLIAVAGRILKGNFLAFFFIEPNVFDAEDITAMSLSAHKSLIRALDNTGIDVTKLRLKQNFKGGRRGEDI